MKNLFSLNNLSNETINHILNLAQSIKDNKIKNISTLLKDKIVANLFFEPSTRTQYSFITAEMKLGAKPIDFNVSNSSLLKSESFYDTVKTFDSFNVDAIVIRDRQDKWYQQLLNKIKTPIINAGDGKCDHPSQTLLDLLTIKQKFGSFKNLKVLIVGDILHSRVAHSNISIMKRLGMEVFVSAPKEFQDKQYQYVNFDEYLPKVDVINMLRIQNERLSSKMKLSIKKYNELFGLNKARINKIKSNAIIIHPAPVNRNVEINDDVVEDKHSFIFKQIENGVYIRMAILLWILNKKFS